MNPNNLNLPLTQTPDNLDLLRFLMKVQVIRIQQLVM